MEYQSTRGGSTGVSAAEAIVRGLAPDGGLYVPAAFPKADLDAWRGLSYPELAAKVVGSFLTDYDPAFLQAAAAAVFFLAMRTLFEAALQKLDGRKAAASKGDGRLTVPRKTISP